jgi:hypothetical protein
MRSWQIRRPDVVTKVKDGVATAVVPVVDDTGKLAVTMTLTLDPDGEVRLLVMTEPGTSARIADARSNT